MFTGIIKSLGQVLGDFRALEGDLVNFEVEVKTDIWNKFKKTKQLSIVKAHKSIDIRDLYHNETVNLFINLEDYKKRKLKVLYLFTNNGIYYLFIRDNYKSLKVDNITCTLTLNFFIRE